MSTVNPDPKNVPDSDEDVVEKYPESTQETETTRKRRAPLIIAALLGVLALIGALTLLPWGGGEENASTEVAQDAYVDDQGQQEHELTPVPGGHEEIDEMSLQLASGEAPVDFVGLTEEGALIPPEDVSRLAWYAASAVPGAEGNSGSTVITGHINHQTQGEGFAYKFTQLAEGDEVTVLVDGKPATYRVTKPPFRVDKLGEAPAELNDATGPNTLVLVTCGGEFVGGSLGYSDNIYVIAEPA